jgi:signal peptidase I
MTDQREEIEKAAGELPNHRGAPSPRKVRPALAFFANFLALGLGYVYVGEIGLAVGMFAGLYGIIAIFAWTRVIVVSATMWWLVWAATILVIGTVLIHPVVIASKNRQRAAKKYNRWWVYILWLLLINGVAFTFRANRAQIFGYEPFRIPSASMSPTVELGDLVLVDTWRYRSHALAVGEIVIVERPENPGVKYIKRVVAVAGDRIEMRDGVLYRNGQTIAEPNVHAPAPHAGSPRTIYPSILGPDLIYVLGDYRDNSLDSRQWGPLTTSSLRGRAQYIWLSIDRRRVRWERVGTTLVP